MYPGCPYRGSKEREGKLHRKGGKENRVFVAYAQQYNAVELNAAHHKLYNAGAIKKCRQIEYSLPASSFKTHIVQPSLFD
jgi:hypothetical protein